MPFFRAPSFSLRYQGSGRIEDVHLFMTYLYRYWYHRGLWGSCVESAVDLLNSCVVFLAVFFLTTVLDWSVALTCDEVSCASAAVARGVHAPALFGPGHAVLAAVALLAAAAAVAFEAAVFLETCGLEREVARMVEAVVDGGHATPAHRLVSGWRRRRAHADGCEEIRLTGDRPFIGNMSWGSFLDTLCEHIQQDRGFGIVAHREFDSLRAVQALMVYDNYIITLHQHGVLERGSLKYADDVLLKLIVSAVFDEFNTLSVGCDRESRVRWQLIKYLAFYVLLYPFVVVFSFTKALVKNAAQMRSGLDNYAARDWSHRARWSFRLYNEVPHILSARLSLGRQTAVNMVDRLQPYSSSKRFLRRASSAIVLITLGLSFLNTSLLIGGTFMGVSFVWWLSIALLVFSMCSKPEPVQREYVYSQDLRKLISQLHYGHSEWCHSGEIFYNALTYDFLKSRFELIVGDLLRTILMPVILLGILVDKSVPNIVNCIRDESVRVDGLGSIARGSAFDMQTYDNENFDKETTTGSFSVSVGEKCAMSVASFSSIYRKWAEKRMQAAGETDAASPDAHSVQQNSLSHFLTELQHRVNDETSAVNYPFFASHGALETNINESVVSHQWQHVTAHEREQLFVSHVPISCDSTHFSREMCPMTSADREGNDLALSRDYRAITEDKNGKV